MIRNEFKCFRQTADGWQPVGRDQRGEHVTFDSEAAARRYAESIGGDVRVFAFRIDAQGRPAPWRVET